MRRMVYREASYGHRKFYNNNYRSSLTWLTVKLQQPLSAEMAEWPATADSERTGAPLTAFGSFLNPEMMAMFGVERLDDRVDFDDDPADVFLPEHIPGPKSDNRTGRRIIPCRSPSTMTKKIILKKVTKR